MGVERLEKATANNGKDADYRNMEKFLGHAEGLVF